MNLKNIRQAQKISQKQLADKLGVDQTTISKWEKGKAYPSINKLKKVSNILICSVDDLIGEG